MVWLAACLVACSEGEAEPTSTPLDAASADSSTFDTALDDSGISLDVAEVGPTSKFTAGHVFLAGARNAEVFEFDASLKLVTRWTHPKFGTVLPAPGQSYDLGPAGMAFDASGNLVVAAVDSFCVFSEPNVVVACHPKVKSQPTENVIFDHLGNIYSTTSTGGTAEIHKYASDYTFVKTFTMPTGELTGVTCDPSGNLFIGSQLGAKSAVYKVDKDTLMPLATISLTGIVEGLQYGSGDTILAAMWDRVVRFDAKPPYAVTTTLLDSSAGLAIAVPVTVDEAGNVYTADYENGAGTAPADLFVWSPDGKLKASRKASEVYGPFGIVIGGTRLPCGAYRPVR